MKYGNGGIRFGLKDHEPFDKSVKTYTLSAEELKKYTEGDPPMLTKEMYLDKKAKGKTDKAIMEEHGMNVASMNAFKKKHELLGVRKPKEGTLADREDWKGRYDDLLLKYKELEQQLKEPANTDLEKKLTIEVEEMKIALENECKEKEKLDLELKDVYSERLGMERELKELRSENEQLRYSLEETDHNHLEQNRIMRQLLKVML